MLALLQCLLVAVIAAEPTTSALGLSPTRHVRSTSRYVEQLIAAGTKQSYTFRSLVTQLERSDVIVYVEPVATLPRHLDGRLLMLSAARDNRFLRIEISPNAPATDLIALIGHELQHALEVASAPEVRDPSSMARLYERIGHRGAAAHQYDTWAALDAGKAVRKELDA